MKKGILIILGMIMMVSTVEAKNGKKLSNNIGYNYSYNNAVNFEDRGIEFFIFTNGEFDFKTNYNNTYYGNSRNREVNINRDFKGRINRIGNSFISYDSFGNVTRIGNVFMRYYRGRLTNVGNLSVRYNSWGNPTFFGNVKDNFYNHNGFRINLNIGNIFSYNDAYFSRNDFRHNYSRISEDRNYYYYRANPNAKIGNKSKTIRRRKPAATIKNNRPATNTRRNNTSYRKPSTTSTKRNTTPDRRSNSSTRKSSTTNTKRNVTPERRTNTSTRRTSSASTKRSVKPVKTNTSTRKPTSKNTKRSVTQKGRRS
jgi:hypothetical protein